MIETIALQAVARSPARVELDLTGVSCFGDDAVEIVAGVRARARLRDIPFLLVTPDAGRRLMQPGGG